MNSFFTGLDWSIVSAAKQLGLVIAPSTPGYVVLKLTLAHIAAIMPYLLLVLILIFRPKGLLGTREG